jgi:hypothetical protein
MNGIVKFKVNTHMQKCHMGLLTAHKLALNSKILVVGIIAHTSYYQTDDVTVWFSAKL